MSSATTTMTLRRSLALVWRTLRSMRTALMLLLLLALAAIGGSLVPQVGVADARIASIYRDHPLRADLYQRLGLFDVFGSWWFTLIYVLLLTSLVACLIPRTRALVRNLRAKPAPTRELETMRHYVELLVASDPAHAIGGARRALRRRWFRVSRQDGRTGLAADKGLAREAGSLLFHWAFLLILVGVVWGKGTGFSGKAVIVEGETWTEAHASYDGQVREGRFFGEDHSGVQVKVDSFTASYRIPSGVPEDFVTRAELFHADGAPAGAFDIRVNHPAEVDGVKLYQFGYGWAPVVEARKDGEPIASGPLVCTQGPAPKGVSPLQLPWSCALRLPTLHPQVGLELTLWPDSRGLFALLQTGTAMPMLVEHAPLLTYTAWHGDLRADRVQGSSVLDTTGLMRFKEGVLGAGRTEDLGDGVTISFPALRQYTVLEVKRDRGLWIELLAAILILLGLLPALYTSRRKVWIVAEPDGTGSRVRIGGFALQRRSQFEEEFGKLVADIERAAGTARPAAVEVTS